MEKMIASEYVSKVPDFEASNGGNRLPEIEKKFRCKIFLWACPSRDSKWECIRVAPFMASETFDYVVDAIVDYTEGEISLFNARLVLNVDELLPEENRLKRTRWTIFEALAIYTNPKLKGTVEKLRSVVDELEQKWGRESVHIADATEFYKMFKMSLQVWCITSCGVRKIRRDKIFDRKGYPKLIGMFQNLVYRNKFSLKNYFD